MVTQNREEIDLDVLSEGGEESKAREEERKVLTQNFPGLAIPDRQNEDEIELDLDDDLQSLGETQLNNENQIVERRRSLSQQSEKISEKRH